MKNHVPAHGGTMTNVIIDEATESDVAVLASLRTTVAERLTDAYGKGTWSNATSEKLVRLGFKAGKILTARLDGRVVGTLRLVTKKPWAIDPTYFTEVDRPIYLVDMAVAVDCQRKGIGRQLLEAAKAATRAWPGQAIRLDAFDSPAGAGDFYAKCGFQQRGRVVYRGTPLVYFEWLSLATTATDPPLPGRGRARR
jgi:GNAT superfamily N-acetyltransferase